MNLSGKLRRPASAVRRLWGRFARSLHNLSLRMKIFLSFSLFITLLILLGITYFSMYAVKITNAQIEESFNLSVQKSAETLAELLNQCEKESGLLAQNQGIINELEEYASQTPARQLSGYYSMSATLQAVSAMSGNNVRIYLPEYQRFLNDRFQFYPYPEGFGELVRGEDGFRQWLLLDGTDAQLRRTRCLFRLRPIYSRTQFGKLLGFACVGVDQARLDAVMGTLRQGTDTPAGIIGTDGSVFYASDPEHPLFAGARWPLADGRDYAAQSVVLEGGRYLQVARRAGSYEAYVATFFPQNNLTRNMHSVWRDSLLTALLVLAVTMCIAYLLSRSISQRVGRLTRAMREYAVGEPFTPLDVRYDDDIGALMQSFNRLAERVNRLVGEVYVAELSRKETQIKFLRAQINPHFLYNTLNIIHCMAMEQKTAEMQDIIQAFSSFIRLSLLDERSHPLRTELSHAATYMAICRYRYGERVRLGVDVEDRFLDIDIPSLTLQPLVENSLLHGLRETGEPLEICVCAQVYDDLFVIEVTDDGVGMDEGLLEQVNRRMNGPGNSGEHFGLRNVQQRLKLLYGDNYGVSILSAPGEGTSCVITLPLPDGLSEP